MKNMYYDSEERMATFMNVDFKSKSRFVKYWNSFVKTIVDFFKLGYDLFSLNFKKFNYFTILGI